MFEHIAMNKTPTGWQVLADGIDITEDVVGWQVEPTSTPSSPPRIWFAFLPNLLILDSKWHDDEEAHP